jgi:uncharacterized protein (TIGR02996 family)
MTDNDFLQSIIESPDDDGPRLVYADFLEERGEPERAEFIRVQCELALLPEPDAQRPSLEAKERQLLAANGEKWAASLKGRVSSWTFRRGFVEVVEVDPTAFLNLGQEILSSAPITHVDFSSGSRSGPQVDLRPLLQSHLFERLRTAGFIFTYYEADEECLRQLANSSMLRERLERLVLWHNPVSRECLRPLLYSESVKQLRRLEIINCDFGGEAAMRFLIESPTLQQIVELSLVGNLCEDDSIQTLASSRSIAALTL